MVTLKWHSMRLAVMTLALLSVMALPASADVVSAGPKVGQWKTWVLASGTEIQVPAPPAETSDQTKAELAELRQLEKRALAESQHGDPVLQRRAGHAALARPRLCARPRRAAAEYEPPGAVGGHSAHGAARRRDRDLGCKVPVQPQATQADGTGCDSSGHHHWRGLDAGAVVSVRARGDRRGSGRHSDGVFPKRRGQLEGHGHGVGADEAAHGRQLPQRHRCRIHTRPGSGAEGSRPGRHRWLGCQVDRHGADRAGILGREEPVGAADGHLEAVAVDAGRSVPSRAAAGFRLGRVQGRAGVAETGQQ